jgi:hypothetical protein
MVSARRTASGNCSGASADLDSHIRRATSSLGVTKTTAIADALHREHC